MVTMKATRAVLTDVTAVQPPDVFDASCPARQVLDLVADKWAVLVLYALAGGTKRTGELQRAVDGISTKMLTQTVRDLERNGLVTRTVHPVVPPKVEYELSPLGETLAETLGALCRWAEEHLEDVERARADVAARSA